jgi:hypothetical protein
MEATTGVYSFLGHWTGYDGAEYVTYPVWRTEGSEGYNGESFPILWTLDTDGSFCRLFVPMGEIVAPKE